MTPSLQAPTSSDWTRHRHQLGLLVELAEYAQGRCPFCRRVFIVEPERRVHVQSCERRPKERPEP